VGSPFWRVRRVAAISVSWLMLSACAASSAPVGRAENGQGPTMSFDYATLDGSHFSSTVARGRRTIVVFLTTYDLVSQVVAREVSHLARTETPRINAAIIVLEPPKNLPLVEAFASSLELTIPVALADAATIGGRGPFGEIIAVPTTFVLDPLGRSVARHEGGVSAGALHESLSHASR